VKTYTPDRIRNVGLFSHGGAGKTSLLEAMLFDTKAITRLGRVEDGNTVSDFDPDEVKRRFSINVSVAPIEWCDSKINIVDAPGYADFQGDVQSALRVVDAAILLLDASAGGVEVGAEQAWKHAQERRLPKMIFVNKINRDNADFKRTVAAARETFGKTIAPIQMPIGQEREFKGIVDLLTEKAMFFHDNHDGGFEIGPIPDQLKADCDAYRLQIVEAIAENDEELMMRYLDDDEISTDELIAGLDHCVEAGLVTPLLCGDATGNRCIQPLLDAICSYFPTADKITQTGELNGEEVEVTADVDGPLAAMVFKTLADPHVGRLSYFRVYSGTFKSNSNVVNSSKGKQERVGQLFLMRGKEHINADAITAGDIGAVGKLAATLTGDTIADEAKPIVLPGIDFPAAVYSAAVTPKTKADLDKMGQALQRIAEEDPTLQVGRDAETGESLLSGLGEPHINISLERMTRRFGVNVDAALPRVAYRETVSGKTLSEYKHKKQTGGAGQYGHVFLEIEPLPEGDFEFGDRVVGGSVPKNFFPAVEKGVREALSAGPVAGYPVVGVKVTLTDGSYHDVDSNEMAFKIASKEAFKKGVLAAKPVLLEPMMNVRITVPDNFTGDVMSDLNGKRGQVSGMTPGDDGTTTIEAIIPAAEVQRYATDLRSITQGRGAFATEFANYQPAPPMVAEQVKAAAAKAAENGHG
jgi:elongation factor G